MKMKASQDITIVLCTYMESELEKNRFMSNYLLFSSDISSQGAKVGFGVCFSGSGRFRDQHFGDVPLGVSGVQGF